MTVEELQNFIADNVHANVDDKIVGQIMSDAANMDFNSFTNKWDEFLQEHSAGWSSVKPNDKDIYTRLREAYSSSDQKNPFAVPENFSDEIYEEKFKDVPRDEYNSSLAKMKELWDAETKERRTQTGRKRRAKEVQDEWPWYKKLLANEYSQARYIDDPNSTPFGKEGKFNAGDNKLELANIGLQGASLVGDAIPGGWGYLTGPGVRTFNDLLQEAGDYGKAPEDIARDRALDLSTSFIGEAGPNTVLRMVGRSEKLGKGLAKGLEETADYASLMKEAKETNSLVEAWKKEPDFARRQKIIEKMPDNYLKTTLKDLDAPGYTVEQLQKMDIPQLKLIPQKEAAVKALDDELIAEGVEGGKYSKEYGWNKKVGDTPEPGPFGKKVAAVSISPLTQGAKTIISRDLAKAGGKQVYDKKPESENDRKVKDWYKKQYSRMWDANFKPKEDSGLLYEAWKEYKGIE